MMVTIPCDEEHTYLSLTVTRYLKDDPLGKYMALLTLSPIVCVLSLITVYLRGDVAISPILWIFIPQGQQQIYLSVAYMSIFLVRRDLQTFILGFGHLCDLVVNKVLKKWFSAPRPEGCVNSGHGMPSNHAQYMSFFATYATLFLWDRVSCETASKIGLTCIFAAWATVVGLSRIYLQCHTIEQVAAGALVGAFTGSLWYLLYLKVLSPLCPMVASWSLCQALHVKDYSQVPNVLAFEHANLQSAIRGMGSMKRIGSSPEKYN